MARKVTVLITDYAYDTVEQVHSMKFTYAGDPADVELAANEETGIEVPSTAPPPAPKKEE